MKQSVAALAHTGFNTTLISYFDSFFTSYFILSHFDGNVFNGTAVWSNWDVRRKEGWNRRSTSDVDEDEEDEGALIAFDEDTVAEGYLVEFIPGDGTGNDAFAFSGNFWGADKSPIARKDTREVVFERVA